MIRGSFGKTLPKVSKIGLGLSQLSNTRKKLLYGYKTRKEVLSIIRLGIKNGINFFDTGNNYGDTENILGNLTNKEKSKIIISTKAGLKKNGKRSFLPSYLEKQVDISLKNLQLERINLFMLNKPSIKDISRNDLIYFLEKLKKKGKIQKSGIIIGDKKGFKKIINSQTLDCFSVLFNLIHTENVHLIKEIYHSKKGVIVRSPLNSGLLNGKFNQKSRFHRGDQRYKIFSKIDYVNKIKRIDLIKKKFDLQSKNLLNYSLRFILNNNHVSTTLIGCSSIRQLREVILCAEKPTKKNRKNFREILDFSEKISKIFKANPQSY